MKFVLNKFDTEINFIDKFVDFPPVHKIVIIDKYIHKLYKSKLDLFLKDTPTYLFEATEANKILAEVENIYSFFIKNKVNRESVVIGIGGGITTDVTAFAASTFKRGCRLQLIPTTFLGMIDAAIGGKTAVNFNGIKNNIGTFYPAEKVIINTEFLKSLSDIELKNGWVECLKVSLIVDNGLYEILKNNNIIVTSEIIEKAIQIKVMHCENDLHDSGERQKLNLGHTFAHLIESASDYSVKHGEAVAIGVRKAADYSHKEKMITSDELKAINEIYDKYKLPKTISHEIKNKINVKGKKLIQQDKKAGKKVKLVLFRGLFDVVVKEIDDYKKIIDLMIQ
ncbi:MAG: 3-dehydroquinate synthase [Candidatus Cloacimonetes bacterium]|nr:3-dehydroquinate synthase [Candidatus Cloacimonadota bacterium]